jgi:hypothetical protein
MQLIYDKLWKQLISRVDFAMQSLTLFSVSKYSLNRQLFINLVKRNLLLFIKDAWHRVQHKI